MKKSNLTNIIIVIVVVLLIGAAGYYYINSDQSASQDLLVSTDAASTATVDSNLLAALQSLKQLKLDTAIFSDPIWLSLIDNSQTLPSQTPGRPNPFAPLDPSLLPAPVTTAQQ